VNQALFSALFVMAALPALGDVLVNGAGATFPYPIYARWFDEYHRLHPQAEINYQPIGSGGGIRQLQAGVIDFGASDCPLTDAQLAGSKVRILHFPTVVGAVVPIYNIPRFSGELRFTPRALAGILLGAITKWNDPEISNTNPGARLPDDEIVPVHRSDGSGTTYIWTEYLSKTSAEWNSRVGKGTSVKWPVGLGAKGNEGVAGLVKQTPNAFGYVELVYALQNRLTFGRVRNAAGKFVRADVRTIGSAAATVADRMPDDFRVSLTDAPGKDSYPVASFTWLVAPAEIEDTGKRRIIADFLRWMLLRGQSMAETLGYATLPAPVVSRELKALRLLE
jgi:phosphate transport system substrate-binding protein